MKGITSVLAKYSGAIASLALVVATISYGTTCTFIFHQPQMPAALEKFKK